MTEIPLLQLFLAVLAQNCIMLPIWLIFKIVTNGSVAFSNAFTLPTKSCFKISLIKGDK